MADHNHHGPPPPLPVNHWSNSDTFMMHNYKVDPCPFSALPMPHDFATCPYTHAGDVFRRHPSHHNHWYCTSNLDPRTGRCYRGDLCPNAHGFYEYNYHPGRYRTMPCMYYGTNDCPFLVCPFYHSGFQRRPATPNYDDDPHEREGLALPPPRPDGFYPVGLPPPRTVIFVRPNSAAGFGPTGGNVHFRPSAATSAAMITDTSSSTTDQGPRPAGFNPVLPPPRTVIFVRPNFSTGGNVDFRPSAATSAAMITDTSSTTGVSPQGPRPDDYSAAFGPNFSTGGNVDFRPSAATSAAMITDTSSSTTDLPPQGPRPDDQGQ